MIPFLIPIFLFFIFVVPFTAALAPILVSESNVAKILFLSLSPITFLVLFLGFSGLLSKPFQKAIISGKFARKLDHPVYGPRRLYGLCWTSVFYSGPAYFIFLTVPFFKKALLRLFGYKGSLNFVVYPDTWIRDLPLLNFGEDVYLSNKSTIGTNICLMNGTILVDKITIENKGMVGHLVMLAPGVFLGEAAEVGVGCAIGIRCKLKSKSKVGPGTVINHGVEVGENTEVGTMSYVGTKTIIASGLKIPGGANIPSGVVLQTQEDVQKYMSSETTRLRETAEKVSQLFAASVEHASPVLRGT